MRVFVRVGTILPLGPVKQYVEEKVDQPLSISIYPGGDASFLLYEDDGNSFDYRKGKGMGMQMAWHDARRVLKLSLANGSRILPPLGRGKEDRTGARKRAARFERHTYQVDCQTRT